MEEKMRKYSSLIFVAVIAVVLAFGSTALAAKKVKWRMGSTWTPAINLYEGEKLLIKYVGEMTFRFAHEGV
jgi:TRAP-type mannitol/chloroaromatic compound transport system substrate-binding protein